MKVEFPPELRERYRPEEVLGAGTFGVVVRATDRELDREVAIKLLHDMGERNQLSRARFEREALLTAKVHSAHVAKLFDHDVSGETAWIVYEYVDGRTLQQHIEAAGKLSFDEAGRILGDILDGLEAIHAEGVLHRDLKPANIMITSTGSAVLIDLGLGRAEQDDTLTATGAALGSPAYMAPEQMTGGEPVVSWDLYAAALTYIQMVTGGLPFVARNLPLTYNLKCEGLTEGLRDQGHPVPEAVDRMLARALDPEPGARFSDAAALREAFAAAWVEEAAPEGERTAAHPALRSTRPERTPRGEGGTRRVAGGAVLGGLLTLGLVVALLPGRTGVAPLPPTSATGPETAPHWGEGETRLAALRLRVEEDPDVRAATRMTAGTPRDQVVSTWERGRAAYRGLVREAGLPDLIEKLLLYRPTPEVHVEATRMQLIQELLTRTTLPGRPPLFPPGQVPDLAALTGRSVRWRVEPSMSGPIEKDVTEKTAQYREALSRGGRRWVAVRSFQDLLVPGRPDLGYLSDVRPQNMAGEGFAFPIPKGPSFLADDVFSAQSRAQARRAPAEVTHELRPVEGDLFLAFIVHGWVQTAHLVLELRGRDRDLPVLFSPPPIDGPYRVGCCNVRQGFLLQVKREILPPGLNRLRIRVRGIQPVSTPKSALPVEEFLQLVEGPPPRL